MKNIRNKRVIKQTVGDLKKSLKDVDDDKEIVLSFMMKDNGVHYVYLADIMTNVKYDSVLQEKLYDSSVVELVGYTDEYATYVERKND